MLVKNANLENMTFGSNKIYFIFCVPENMSLLEENKENQTHAKHFIQK